MHILELQLLPSLLGTMSNLLGNFKSLYNLPFLDYSSLIQFSILPSIFWRY